MIYTWHKAWCPSDRPRQSFLDGCPQSATNIIRLIIRIMHEKTQTLSSIAKKCTVFFIQIGQKFIHLRHNSIEIKSRPNYRQNAMHFNWKLFIYFVTNFTNWCARFSIVTFGTQASFVQRRHAYRQVRVHNIPGSSPTACSTRGTACTGAPMLTRLVILEVVCLPLRKIKTIESVFDYNCAS